MQVWGCYKVKKMFKTISPKFHLLLEIFFDELQFIWANFLFKYEVETKGTFKKNSDIILWIWTLMFYWKHQAMCVCGEEDMSAVNSVSKQAQVNRADLTKPSDSDVGLCPSLL